MFNQQDKTKTLLFLVVSGISIRLEN